MHLLLGHLSPWPPWNGVCEVLWKRMSRDNRTKTGGYPVSTNLGSMPKTSTHVLSTTRKHTRGIPKRSFRDCCKSTVLTATHYWPSNGCIPAHMFVSVSAEINPNRSPWVLDSNKKLWFHHSSSHSVWIGYILTVGSTRVSLFVAAGSTVCFLWTIPSYERDLELPLFRFSATCDQGGMKTSTKRTEDIMSLQKPKVVYAASERQGTTAVGEVQVTWGGIHEYARIGEAKAILREFVVL